MAARHRIWTPEIVRERIQVAKLMDRLEKEALGLIEMTDGQRASAMYLITQAIGKPHQSATVAHTVNHVSELTDRELGDIATGGRAGVAEKAPRPLNS